MLNEAAALMAELFYTKVRFQMTKVSCHARTVCRAKDKIITLQGKRPMPSERDKEIAQKPDH